MVNDMRHLSIQRIAIHFSVWLHAGLLLVMAYQSSSLLAPTQFAGNRQAVVLSATFVPPVPPSEPEPVEVAPSEMDAEETLADVPADATIAKRTLEIRPTAEFSDWLVDSKRATPQAKLAERRQFQRQRKPIIPQAKPLPRQVRPIEIASRAAAKPVPIGTSDTTPPDFSMNASPVYPAVAQQNGWTGEVLLQLTVGKDGAVLRVSIVESSGHAVLDQAAAAAVRSWRGNPATQAGAPVVDQRTIRIRFQPRRDASARSKQAGS